MQKDYSKWIVTQNRNTPNVTEKRTDVTEIQTLMLRKSRHTKDNKDIIQKTGAHPLEMQKNSRPPSVKVYAEETRYVPAPGGVAWRAIAEGIPSDKDSLDRWRETVKAWMLHGYNTRNIAGMLEWYKEGRTTREGWQERRDKAEAETAADDQIARYKAQKAQDEARYRRAPP